MRVARREQVLQALREAESAMGDDELAARAGINRHYVNQICRRLAVEGLVTRERGPSGVLLNRLNPHTAHAIEPPDTRAASVVASVPTQSRVRVDRHDRARVNIELLVDRFDVYVQHFEAENRFGGPSRYFHDRAIERRRRHDSVAHLLADELFLEYVYAVLPAWGMHRMGNQAAKVGEFADIVSGLRAARTTLEELWPLRLTDISADIMTSVGDLIWDVIASLRVSTSGTQIVAGSKTLHHVLPDLVPPIDRQYTFRFFTGQKAVQAGDKRAFIEWFPYFVEIANRCSGAIRVAMSRGGFMATSPTKVIDNAIIGLMKSGGDFEPRLNI